MNLIAIGTNHKYSPMEIREKISFPKKRLKAALNNLVSYKAITAGVILSTCSRVEIYAECSDLENGLHSLREFLLDYHRISDNLDPYLYTYINQEAWQHLFTVATGLDSQIIGESQILEQVKSAFQEAKLAQTTNTFLEDIFSAAAKVTCRIRKETTLSYGDISLATLTIDFIKTRYGCLEGKKILIIGLGKISQSVIRVLKKERLKAVFISNRNYDKAKEFAKDIPAARVVRFEELKENLLDADIIISATASPHLILKKEDLKDLHRPLLIIDLSLPRDIDPRIKEISGVNLFFLDDLDFAVENRLRIKQAEMDHALEIIQKEAKNLCLPEPLEWQPAAALLR